jgi:hypothetical protein
LAPQQTPLNLFVRFEYLQHSKRECRASQGTKLRSSISFCY